jgi:anti-anti-sigma factor
VSGVVDLQYLAAEPRVSVSWPGPTAAVVLLEGEHDLGSAPELEDALGNALLTCSELLVDLSSAQFVDSSTIHALVKAKKEADDKGCAFTLVVDGSPNVEQTLRICGVLDSLNHAPGVGA